MAIATVIGHSLGFRADEPVMMLSAFKRVVSARMGKGHGAAPQC